ncbi:MAG TPA: response regulator [Abditibacteriaceae bacterium]
MSKQILVVDDEPNVVSVLRIMLEHAGYKVSTAGNGVQALESVAASRPDLILLDQMMPQMDGTQVLRNLKGRDETKDIPVVILSAKDEPADLMKGWESGTDLYLVKPIVGAELTDYIDCILND